MKRWKFKKKISCWQFVIGKSIFDKWVAEEMDIMIKIRDDDYYLKFLPLDIKNGWRGEQQIKLAKRKAKNYYLEELEFGGEER